MRCAPQRRLPLLLEALSEKGSKDPSLFCTSPTTPTTTTTTTTTTSTTTTHCHCSAPVRRPLLLLLLLHILIVDLVLGNSIWGVWKFLVQRLSQDLLLQITFHKVQTMGGLVLLKKAFFWQRKCPRKEGWDWDWISYTARVAY